MVSGVAPARQRYEALSNKAKLLSMARAQVEQALSLLSTTIEAAKKAALARQDAQADPALENLLRRHQQLSDRWAQVARTEAELGQSLFRARSAVASALDRAIGMARTAVRARRRDPAARRVLRSLLQDRAQLAELPSAAVCPLANVRVSPEDGPAERREKADLLEDVVERCKRQLRKVEKRLRALFAERRLLREAGEFRAESVLFDEESRRRYISSSMAAQRSEPATDRVPTLAAGRAAPAPETAGAGFNAGKFVGPVRINTPRPFVPMVDPKAGVPPSPGEGQSPGRGGTEPYSVPMGGAACQGSGCDPGSGQNYDSNSGLDGTAGGNRSSPPEAVSGNAANSGFGTPTATAGETPGTVSPGTASGDSGQVRQVDPTLKSGNGREGPDVESQIKALRAWRKALRRDLEQLRKVQREFREGKSGR